MTEPTGSSLNVATADRVALELPLAGLGSRAMAYLVDLFLVGGVALVAYFLVTLIIPDPVNAVLGLSTLARSLGIGALGVFLWVYWTAFEVAWNGQSPGKRLVGIRVVQADGAPTTVFTSAVRNLVRLVDFLPACYPVGVISMLVDRKHRRLGDLLAGTVLVREQKIDLAAYAQLAASPAIEVNLLEIATQFLARYETIEAPARARVGRLLAKRLDLSPTEHATADDVRELIRQKVQGA